MPRNPVPRPPNPFILYRIEKLKELAATKQTGTPIHMKDASKMIGPMWEHESDERKAHYVALAAQKKIEHQIAHPDYRYTPRKRADIVREREEKRLENIKLKAQLKTEARRKSKPYPTRPPAVAQRNPQPPAGPSRYETHVFPSQPEQQLMPFPYPPKTSTAPIPAPSSKKQAYNPAVTAGYNVPHWQSDMHGPYRQPMEPTRAFSPVPHLFENLRPEVPYLQALIRYPEIMHGGETQTFFDQYVNTDGCSNWAK